MKNNGVNMNKMNNNGAMEMKGMNKMNNGVNIEGIKSFKQIDKLNNKEKAAKALESLIKNSVVLSGHTKKSQALTLEEKRKDVELSLAFEIQKGANALKFEPIVSCVGSSRLTRCKALHKDKLIFAEKAMTLTGIGTRDIVSFKLSKEFSKETNRNFLLGAFKVINDGIFVTYNEKTGKTNVFLSEENITKKMMENKDLVAYKYQFLGITPSGLRGATVMTAATKKYVNNNGDIIATDWIDRISLLNEELDGAFIPQFMEETNGQLIFKKLETINVFKLMSRELLGVPASKTIFTARNYIIMDNIAKHAMYNKDDYDTPEFFNGVSCEDTQDGASLTAGETILEAFELEGKHYHILDVLGIALQLRGASAKKSSLVKRRRVLVNLFNYILEVRGSQIQAQGEYTDLDKKEAGLQALINTKDKEKSLVIVLDGQRYEGEEITMDIVNQALKKIQILGDWNAYKLRTFNPVYDVVSLKQAHASQTRLNTVVNFMMQQVDAVECERIIKKFTKIEIAKRLRDIGFDISVDIDGDATDIKIDFEKSMAVNNDSQFSQFLFKNNKKEMAWLAPQIMKANLQNQVTSIKNLIDVLNPSVSSLYTVVQSDPAVLYGCRLLNYNEIHCNEYKGIKKVSGLRHPISSPDAVTTFNVVTNEEILRRIADLKLPAYIKDDLKDHFLQSKGFCTIPASHDLMEKHDGMDFDIDSMQMILEEEVVNILSKVTNNVTIIDRKDDVKKGISVNKSQAEMLIEKFKSGEIYALPQFPKDNTAPVYGDVKNPLIKMKGLQGTKERNKIDTSFESICNMVKNYFTNPVASIGMIATGFYNNEMLLNYLKSSASDIEVKEKIAFIFREEYKCSSNKKYISPIGDIITEEGNKGTILNKTLCTRVLFNYKESDGSLESTIAFLEDCCRCNRYPSETSIDATKNGYKVVDIFNHSSILRAIGSDKNSEMELDYSEQNDILFGGIVNSLNESFVLNYSPKNVYGLHLLKYSNNCTLINDITKEELARMVFKNQSTGKKIFNFGVEEMFAKIKKELVDYANFLCVACVKALEDFANSPEAKAYRREVIDEALINDKGVIVAMEGELGSLISTHIVINNTIGNSDDFGEQNANIYKKKVALKVLKNTAALMLQGKSKKEIGCGVMAYIANQYEKKIKEGKVSSINRGLLSIFDEEILCYLETKGFNVKAGEKVLTITKDGRAVSPKELIGREIEFNNGTAIIKDYVDTIEEYYIVSENKRSNEKGELKIIEGQPYVVFDREITERDTSLGCYFSINANNGNITPFLANKIDFENKSISSIEFVSKGEGYSMNDRFFNRFFIHGQAANGQKLTGVAFDIYATPAMAEMIESLENSSFSVYYASKEKAFLSSVNGYPMWVTQTGEEADFSGFVHYKAPCLKDVIDNILMTRDMIEEEDEAEVELEMPDDDILNLFTSSEGEVELMFGDDSMSSPVLNSEDEGGVELFFQ